MMLQGVVAEGIIIGYNKGGVLVDIGEIKGAQPIHQQLHIETRIQQVAASLKLDVSLCAGLAMLHSQQQHAC